MSSGLGGYELRCETWTLNHEPNFAVNPETLLILHPPLFRVWSPEISRVLSARSCACLEAEASWVHVEVAHFYSNLGSTQCSQVKVSISRVYASVYIPDILCNYPNSPYRILAESAQNAFLRSPARQQHTYILLGRQNTYPRPLGKFQNRGTFWASLFHYGSQYLGRRIPEKKTINLTIPTCPFPFLNNLTPLAPCYEHCPSTQYMRATRKIGFLL